MHRIPFALRLVAATATGVLVSQAASVHAAPREDRAGDTASSASRTVDGKRAARRARGSDSTTAPTTTPTTTTTTTAPTTTTVQAAPTVSATSTGTVAPVAQSNVSLDAARVVSETGTDDLAAARRLFGSASMPEANGGLAPGREITEAIGITAARSINDASECGLDAAGNIANCGRLAGNLAWMKRYGLAAHVVVGQRQPAFIGVPGSQWGPGEWARYQDFADKLVRFVAAQYDGTGFAESLIEVGNEIDITNDPRDLFTLADPQPPQGDASRYEHYMRLYRVWSQAVARVQAENPSKRVLAAGPAVGGQGLFLSGGIWHPVFLQRVIAEGLRLDVMTHHFYGDIVNGWSNVPGSALRDQIAAIRTGIVAQGRAGMPIYVTEWGQSSDTGGGAASTINWRHEGGAWAARFLHDAIAGGALGGSYLLMRDVFGANATGIPALPSFTHVRDGVDHPKPATNVFRMVGMLPGARRAVAVDPAMPTVRALGGASDTAAGLLVFNYDYDFAARADRTVAQTVRVGFGGLPFSGAVTVERWLVDEATSNVGRFIDAGTAPDPAQTRLARVESFTANVSGGTLVLDARTLGPSAVSLWVVRRQ